MLDHGDNEATSPDVQVSLCEHCGGAARVYILEGYVEGIPLRQYLCLECARATDERRLETGPAQAGPRPSLASLLTATGLLLTILGASVDQLAIETSVGFGLKQQTSLLIGTLIIILGGLLRVDVLTVGGSILFAVAALADVFGTMGTPGVGWQQGATIMAGLLLLLAGLLLSGQRSGRRLLRAD